MTSNKKLYNNKIPLTNKKLLNKLPLKQEEPNLKPLLKD